MGKTTAPLEDGSDTEFPGQVDQTPEQEAIRDIAWQIAELIGPDNGRGEAAEVITEIVQLAAGAASYIGEKKLPFLTLEPHTSGNLELPVAGLSIAGEQHGRG